MASSLEWKGDQVRAKIDDATPKAIDEVLDNTARAAQESHPGWKSESGKAERSIRAVKATKRGKGWVGEIGSFDVNYFVWLEIGARGHAGDHTLRRASDLNFHELSDRIRKAAGLNG